MTVKLPTSLGSTLPPRRSASAVAHLESSSVVTDTRAATPSSPFSPSSGTATLSRSTRESGSNPQASASRVIPSSRGFKTGIVARLPGASTTEVVDSVQGSTKLDVYQTSGPFFGGGGLGIQYAVSPDAAMVIEVAGRALFPDFAPVIAPSLGFTLGL